MNELKIDYERDEFEKVYSEMIGCLPSVLKIMRIGDDYHKTEGERLSIAWGIWKAARESK